VKISVIVPTYNRRNLLERTLNSLFQQDYPEYEIIVVNDGSQDGTHEYLKSLAAEGKIKYHRHENSGLAATRKEGLKHALGELIAFTDDDCVVPNDWLSKLAKQLSHTEIGGVGGATRTGNPENIFAVSTDIMQNYFKQAINKERVEVPFFTGNNVAYKRTSLEKVGGPDPRFRMGAEDRDLTFRVAQTGATLVYDPSIVVEHHNDSTFWKFLRHQFDFGKGSYLFYTVTASLGKLPSRMPLSLYVGLLFFPFRMKQKNALLVSILLLLAQFATAAGFLSAVLSGSKSFPSAFLA
jgi:cellulose synthase/poly-beta-1,6-N-acetylglucosamine synthase-like glycosyltransferase